MRSVMSSSVVLCTVLLLVCVTASPTDPPKINREALKDIVQVKDQLDRMADDGHVQNYREALHDCEGCNKRLDQAADDLKKEGSDLESQHAPKELQEIVAKEYAMTEMMKTALQRGKAAVRNRLKRSSRHNL